MIPGVHSSQNPISTNNLTSNTSKTPLSMEEFIVNSDVSFNSFSLHKIMRAATGYGVSTTQLNESPFLNDFSRSEEAENIKIPIININKLRSGDAQEKESAKKFFAQLKKLPFVASYVSINEESDFLKECTHFFENIALRQEKLSRLSSTSSSELLSCIRYFLAVVRANRGKLDQHGLASCAAIIAKMAEDPVKKEGLLSLKTIELLMCAKQFLPLFTGEINSQEAQVCQRACQIVAEEIGSRKELLNLSLPNLALFALIETQAGNRAITATYGHIFNSVSSRKKELKKLSLEQALVLAHVVIELQKSKAEISEEEKEGYEATCFAIAAAVFNNEDQLKKLSQEQRSIFITILAESREISENFHKSFDFVNKYGEKLLKDAKLSPEGLLNMATSLINYQNACAAIVTDVANGHLSESTNLLLKENTLALADILIELQRSRPEEEIYQTVKNILPSGQSLMELDKNKSPKEKGEISRSIIKIVSGIANRAGETIELTSEESGSIQKSFRELATKMIKSNQSEKNQTQIEENKKWIQIILKIIKETSDKNNVIPA